MHSLFFMHPIHTTDSVIDTPSQAVILRAQKLFYKNGNAITRP
ncbi:hypothetical protein H650_22025 [Enterobacter sp. R4-368]|nr:hypothetical protein H650_22025 [Enterobacter sp. R4-368]